MKRKRQEILERRRPLIELNLIAEPRGILAARRRGCLQLLTPALLGLTALLALGTGLR